MDTTDVELLRTGLARQIADADAWPTWRDKRQLEVFRELVSDKFTDEQIAHSYFKLPTGYGKTVMFARMARAYFDALIATGTKKHQKIVIIVPRLSLIEQTQKKLKKFANITATEFSGKKKDNSSDVVITTYNSLVKLFGVVDFNDVALIFADEAHHMLGAKFSEQLTFYNQFVPIIGFTATPEYEANRAVANMLNTEIYAMNIPEAVDRGVLSPVKNILYRSSIVCDLSNVPATNTGDYDYEKITAQISPEKLATEIAHVYAEGFDEETGVDFHRLKAIINCPNAAIANLQAAKINEIMGRDVAISLHKVGIGDKEYDRLKGDFEDGKYTVACQVGTLTEGFDDVTVALCINYPTRSRVKAEQTAGRAIRIDENNEYKFAFVIDTLFRSTPDARDEDILYTASNSHQILFKDIAESNVVLDPKKIQEKLAEKNPARIHKHNTVEFVDYKLITDSATLIALNRRAEERIADEFIPEKTDEWQSATDLYNDVSFPMRSEVTIRNKLQELQPAMPEYIKMRQPIFGQACLCLHRGGRQEFLNRVGYVVAKKTEEWQSATDLKNDETFPMGKVKTIIEKLQELQSKMPEYIQMRKPKYGPPCLCLHGRGREEFLKKLGSRAKEFPKKTEEWQSAVDLANDETFPMSEIRTIRGKLQEMQSAMSKYIKMRKPAIGHTCLCLHREGRQSFLEKVGLKAREFPQKTEEWQSATDLGRDKTFPMSEMKTIRSKLQELQSKMPEYIQMRKPVVGQACLCLHKDGREEFLRMVKQKSLQDGTKVVGAMSAVQDIENSTRPDDPHVM